MSGPPTVQQPGVPARVEFEVWSTTATVLVTDPRALRTAVSELRAELASVDLACSRFRSDSEITRLLSCPGRDIELSSTLNAAITHALRVAAATDYLVDPTVAAAVIALGYDGDIGAVTAARTPRRPPGNSFIAAPGAWRLEHDPDAALLRVPPGVGLDLGATAKALAADRAAERISRLVDGGVLVGIGGDFAARGTAPDGGWRIEVADDHRPGSPAHQVVSIGAGGLATSSIAARRWRTAGGWAHHIIDPRTGNNPEPRWRTATVAAASCVDANAAATAAIVMGTPAPQWLSQRDLPALLVDVDGSLRFVGGWPSAQVAA